MCAGARQDRIRYLPTAYLALMDLLHTTRPHHTLIAADFNKLPDVRIPGTCAPLVSSLVRPSHRVATRVARESTGRPNAVRGKTCIML